MNIFIISIVAVVVVILTIVVVAMTQTQQQGGSIGSNRIVELPVEDSSRNIHHRAKSNWSKLEADVKQVKLVAKPVNHHRRVLNDLNLEIEQDE